MAGLEPTTSASAGLRSILLSYKRQNINVPKGRFELPRPYGHYALNVARLPFRHFGKSHKIILLYQITFVNLFCSSTVKGVVCHSSRPSGFLIPSSSDTICTGITASSRLYVNDITHAIYRGSYLIQSNIMST